MLCILNVGTVPTLCILYVGTVPTLCILNVGTVPTFSQTWKKARTRGHCPRKFLRIVEIFGLWKIIHLYFRRNPKNCGNIWFNIDYLSDL